MNKINPKKEYTIKASDVTIDPINNFYEKINKNINSVIDDFFDEFLKTNPNVIQKQESLKKEIINHQNEIKEKKKELKINLLKFQNALIIISFFILIGLFFIPKFKSNNQIIKSFNNYKNIQEKIINNLQNHHYAISLQFFSQISYLDILQYVTKSFNLHFENNCISQIYQLYKDQSDFLDFRSCLLFKYKNTPIVNTFTKHLEHREIITSETRSYPYTAYETYVDSEGRTRTRAVTRYETLTATHSELTPFVIKKNNLWVLTNFKPDLEFSTLNKKYLDFENNKFAKTYKIATNRNNIDADILHFFTIKAQEDYLNWYEKYSTNIDFSKIGQAFLFNINNEDISNNINTKFNLQYKINDKMESIQKTKIIIKETIKNYFLEISKNIMLCLMSPAINREWFQTNNEYKILQSNNFESDLVKEKIDLDYIISRVFKRENLYFINQESKRTPWLTISSRKKTADGFYEFDCILNSYQSEFLIDYVTVVGFHTGTHVIPVRYEKFDPIFQSKKIYFLEKEKENNNVFAMSSKIDNTYFDLEKWNNNDDNASFINWTDKVKLWMINPFLIINNQNKKDRFVEIINELKDNFDSRISIESLDVGYFIIVNTQDESELESNELKGIIRKIKNLILELNSL